MSKVVKSVGRAVSKVVSGVGKVISKIPKSKIGKAVLMASGVYFTGGAALGAIGGASAGAAAGTGFMGTLGGALSGAISGAGAGIASAWGGLTGAASALAGGSLSGFGSSLSGGLTGAYGAGAGTIAPTLGAVAEGAAGAGAFTGSTSTGLATVAGDAANVAGTVGGATTPGWASVPGSDMLRLASEVGGGNASSGLLGKFMASPYTAPALISGGSQLLGGVMQGYGAQKQQEHQEQLTGEARDRYNQNIGQLLYPRAR